MCVRVGIFLFSKTLLISLVLSAVWVSPAQAACGEKGRKYCDTIVNRLGGFDCERGLAKDSKGICRPCGRADQLSCERARSGPVCRDYTENLNGFCRVRGGQGQKPYSGGLFDCRPGHNVGGNGLCTRCGRVDQPACERKRPGNMCLDGTEEKGGQCVATAEARLLTAAKTDLQRMGPDLLDLITAAYEYSDNESMQQAAENGDVPGGSGSRGCVLRGSYRSTTYGVAGSASLVLKLDGEYGVATRCNHTGRKAYSSAGMSWRPSIGSSVVVTKGEWKKDYTSLRGDIRGVSFDFASIASNVSAFQNRDLSAFRKPGVAMGLVLYFEESEDKFLGWGEHVGAVIFVGGSIGADLGADIVSTTLVQRCWSEDECGLGTWKTDDNGETIRVLEHDIENRKLVADISTPRLKRSRAVLKRQQFDRRDWYLEENGEKIAWICFRQNHTRMRYIRLDRDCDDGSRLQLQDTAQPTASRSAASRNAALVKNTATSTALVNSTSTRPQPKPAATATAKPQAKVPTPVAEEWRVTDPAGDWTLRVLNRRNDMIYVQRIGEPQAIQFRTEDGHTFSAEDGTRLRFSTSSMGVWKDASSNETFIMRRQ